MRPWLKAGLIGGGGLAVLVIIRSLGMLFPRQVSEIICGGNVILFLLTSSAVGVLAAYWLEPPRTAGAGAKEGALAGVIAGAIDSVALLITALIMAPVKVQEALHLMPPELQVWEERGLSSLFLTGSFLTVRCIRGIFDLLLAVALGAVGGAILAAIKRD